MAKEYIKREAVLNALYDNEYTTLCPLDEVSSVIDAIPTADVVEVVRCKDCKYSCDEDITGKYILCNRKMLGMVRAEDFCSFGEGRDNDG